MPITLDELRRALGREPGHGVAHPGVREMHADLMRAAGEQAHFEQTEVLRLFDDLHFSKGTHPTLTDTDPPLAGTAYIFVQWLADVEPLLGGRALHHGGVDLLDLAV